MREHLRELDMNYRSCPRYSRLRRVCRILVLHSFLFDCPLGLFQGRWANKSVRRISVLQFLFFQSKPLYDHNKRIFQCNINA